jgi:hypothetical protein
VPKNPASLLAGTKKGYVSPSFPQLSPMVVAVNPSLLISHTSAAFEYSRMFSFSGGVLLEKSLSVNPNSFSFSVGSSDFSSLRLSLKDIEMACFLQLHVPGVLKPTAEPGGVLNMGTTFRFSIPGNLSATHHRPERI